MRGSRALLPLYRRRRGLLLESNQRIGFIGTATRINGVFAIASCYGGKKRKFRRPCFQWRVRAAKNCNPQN